MLVACKSDKHDGEGVGLGLGDDRFVDVLWQAPANADDLVAHIGRGRIGSRVSLKRTVMSEFSAREDDVITSTPSMPEANLPMAW